MKAIIRRDRTTGAIVDDLGEYELLKAQGRTDEEIAELVEDYNKKHQDEKTIAELVELDEFAQHYKMWQKRWNADENDALADMAERLQDLASELEGFVRRLRR